MKRIKDSPYRVAVSNLRVLTTCCVRILVGVGVGTGAVTEVGVEVEVEVETRVE